MKNNLENDILLILSEGRELPSLTILQKLRGDFNLDTSIGTLFLHLNILKESDYIEERISNKGEDLRLRVDILEPILVLRLKAKKK